jgi:hypothetical protein
LLVLLPCLGLSSAPAHGSFGMGSLTRGDRVFRRLICGQSLIARPSWFGFSGSGGFRAKLCPLCAVKVFFWGFLADFCIIVTVSDRQVEDLGRHVGDLVFVRPTTLFYRRFHTALPKFGSEQTDSNASLIDTSYLVLICVGIKLSRRLSSPAVSLICNSFQPARIALADHHRFTPSFMTSNICSKVRLCIARSPPEKY